MHSSEPARKKLKLSGDLDKAQEALKARTDAVESKREPSNATDTCDSSVCKQNPPDSAASTASDPEPIAIFVLDTDSRLFATEVTESQQLWSVLEGLVSSGCKGVEPGTLLHCRGQIQQDVHKTVGEAMICAGCTLSLAKPGFTDRWEAFAEMATVFYELFDEYEATYHNVNRWGPMSDEMCEKCKQASEVQHKFLGAIFAHDDPVSSKAKLMSFLEADCIPVLARMLDSNMSMLNTGLADFHWAACTRLVCIEGYTSTAMYITSSKKNPALFPWVFFLMLELTVGQCAPESNYEDQPTCRQVQKLGEMLEIMRRPWSPWSDLLPSSCFDASAQHHAVVQLARCVTIAAKVITHGLQTVKDHVTSFTSRDIKPDESELGLELSVAWSTLVEVFMTLQSKLTDNDTHEVLQMLHSFLNLLRQLTETCKAVELFAAACLRLGIPPNNNPVDPYTGDPMPDSSNPYAAVVPLVLRQHLTALLPGIHALTNARLDNPSIPEEYQQLKDWLPCFVTVPVPQAVLKAADLRPDGVLYRAVTSSDASIELQQQLPEDLRRKYLYELFPDLTVEANYEEEADHHELVVSRDELNQQVYTGSCNADITRGLSISFQDELGQGSGVMKEWITMVTKHFFGKAGVFQQCPEDPATVHPARNPAGDSDWPFGPETMKQAGRLAGLAMCYRCPIGIRLSKACLKMMSGRQLRLEDFQEVDPQLYTTLLTIQAASEDELKAMDLTFESPAGKPFKLQHDVPLGEAVTTKNREQYVNCLCDYFFICRQQVDHFLQGLCSMSEWENWFDQDDSESDRLPDSSLTLMLRPLVVDDFGRYLAGNIAPLDVGDWRRATVAREFWYEQAQQHLDWFWEMVEEWDDDQRRQLLCFWTSMSTVPAGGFQELSSKLKLQPSTQGLPSSHTCFFQLNMPRYASLQAMKAAFTTAIEESKGFGFG